MLDLVTLQNLWFFIVGAVIIIYAATAGFDFGVTMIMPFFKNESDRRVALNTVGPTWDGNQTWIVFAGGAIFCTYPPIYATVFSGFYAAMLFILWSFFLRPPGFDYRSKIDSHFWRRMWDCGLCISAFFPTVIFGVAFGNFMVGIPFHFDPFMMRSYYTGNFWGLLNQFSIVCGTIAVFMFLMHGASLLTRRTEGDLQTRAFQLTKIFAGLLFILMTIAALLVSFSVKGYILVHSPADAINHPLRNTVIRETGAYLYSVAIYPWKIAAPLIAYLGLLAVLLTPQSKRNFLFWSSVVSVAGIVMTAGFNLYPFVCPSSTNLSESFTAWNATASQYRMNTSLWIVITMLLIILTYKLYAYWTIWHKKPTVNAQDIEDNEHTAY